MPINPIVDQSTLPPFSMTPDMKARVSLSDKPISTVELAMRINDALPPQKMRLLMAQDLEEAFVRAGYLVYTQSDDGFIVKTPTEKAISLGATVTRKTLAGAGTYDCILFGRPFQQEVLLHLHALLGLDSALDVPFTTLHRSTPDAIKRMRKEGQDTPKKSASFRFCWNCESRIPSRFMFTCEKCGWQICPKCGVCRNPRFGGCSESSRGLGRFTGLLKDKNDCRVLLQNHGLLDGAMFDELKAVSDPEGLRAFREKFADEFSHVEALRAERREERSEEAASKKKEERLNARGYYRIVSASPRTVTYQNARGVKKTVPNRPPIRVGSEYVDLSGIPEKDR